MSHPRTAARLPRSRPRTAGSGIKRQPTTGGGDTTTTSVNLDEELQTVLRKEYDAGESGTKEAIRDVKTVLKEVAKTPVAEAMDKVMPRFLTPGGGGTPHSAAGSLEAASNRNRSSNNRHTPRHAKLTARPYTSRQLTEESRSSRHLPSLTGPDMRHTASAPTLPDSRRATPITSYPNSRRATPISHPDTSDVNDESSSVRGGLESERLTTKFTSTDEDGLQKPTTGGYSDEFTSRVTGGGGEEDTELDEEELPFTENLLQIPSDSEDTEEIWKSDIVELTKMKSAPRGKMCGGDTLELKYKEPMWPHQLLLDQILAKLPRLTHLILDGSELRFLRDLGSSLQSLITLSICDCGLRSLDGAYAFPNLRTLIARKNMIRIPTQCSFLTRLSYLDLSSNPISSFDEFGSLRHCGELRILKLHDTPVATRRNFNKEMKRFVPQLKEIHPPRLDMLQLNQITKPGQTTTTTMRSESKQVENKEQTTNSSVPSMAYNDVMVDEPKPGIAYQKISSKTKQQLDEQSEIEDVRLGSGVYMAPKFLQHLEQAMPPSTAEDLERQTTASSVASTTTTPANYEDEIYGGGGESPTKSLGNKRMRSRLLKKKSDAVHRAAAAPSNKNHPGGDGDSWCN